MRKLKKEAPRRQPAPNADGATPGSRRREPVTLNPPGRYGVGGGLLPLVANIAFFFFGTAAWIFKFGDERSGYLLPASPSQAGLPLMGLLALFVSMQVWRLRFPQFAIRAWSMRLVNIGFLCVLIGTAVHIAGGGEYRMEAILYFGRWLLPWSALLMIAFGMRHGGQKDYAVYGLLFGCAVSVFCVEAKRQGVPIPMEKMGDSRFAGLLNHANDYGILTSSTAPLIIYLLHKKRWIARALGCGFTAVFTEALFESLSKTNMILFPLALAVTFIAYSLNSFQKIVRAIVLIAAAAFIASSLFAVGLQILQASDPKQYQILTQFVVDPGSVASLDDRQNAWDEAGARVSQNPWFGMGPGWARDHLLYMHAHNLFLQAWIDVGLFGLVGAILLTAGILFRNGEVFRAAVTYRKPMDDEIRLQIACAIALLTAMLGNSMSSSLQTTTMQSFAMFIGLSFADPRVKAPQRSGAPGLRRLKVPGFGIVKRSARPWLHGTPGTRSG